MDSEGFDLIGVEDEYTVDKWDMQVVYAAAESNSLRFPTQSSRKYSFMAWCIDTSKRLFFMDNADTITAMENGGKTVQIELKFVKNINTVKDNSIVNKILCLFATEL